MTRRVLLFMYTTWVIFDYYKYNRENELPCIRGIGFQSAST